jgi:beta-mannosidase
LKTHRLTKRSFLATTAAATAAVWTGGPFLSTGRAAAAGTCGRWWLDLNGRWRVAQAGTSHWIAATVPGCVHTDLLAAGKIPDPFYRDNEQAMQWVGESDWVYRRSFRVPASALASTQVLLRCEGIDTLAAMRVNGQDVGRTDNMFRTWEFDVKPMLRTGENTIEITFASPLPIMQERQAKRPLYEWIGSHEPKGRAWVRKQPCNFGWDWGPVLITCGIWRNISLVAFSDARLEDVAILQDHSASGRVGLEVQVAAQVADARNLKAAVTVSHQGQTVASTAVALTDGKGKAALEIVQPKLWWPTGMGEQPLYEVRVDLLDADGAALDSTTKRIGLRTLNLLAPEGQNPLRFEVNGIPFFAKGANCIPFDAFYNRVTPAIQRRYVADAVAVNMNSLRFWGGGYYEDDALFDACDELGVCVWMDMKFACSSYPAFDEAFMESVRQEVRDNLRRLRHHACIGVWCGNNEISLMTKPEWSDKSMGRADYDKLFKEMLGNEAKTLAPQANYVSGSPDCGDTHSWEVWHGGKTFEAYRNLTGFPSEFGFQSFPQPKTVRAFTTEADRASVVTPVMDWHQRSPNGNAKIRDMTTHYFKPPKDFENALWLSQILQGFGIKLGAEYWRQTMPRTMGCVYWQYNDCWPGVSWSSVDYFGRWKALHYMARRFYAPLLVSGLENVKESSVDFFISSDRLEACRGTVTWTVTDVEGRSLASESAEVEIAPRTSAKVKSLDLRSQVQQRGANGLLTWLKLTVGGKVVSENLVLLAAPKELALREPQLKSTVEPAPDGFWVTLQCAKPALWTWLDLEGADAKFSDNFFHVTPDAPARILVRPQRRMTTAEFTRALRVRSLIDTYA